MKEEKVLELIRELMPFIETVLRYEDVSITYPYENDYFRFNRDDISDRRRFEKVIFYHEWLLDVLKNAERRYCNQIDLNRWELAKEKAKQTKKLPDLLAKDCEPVY